jgi:DNA repair protein RadD
VIELHGYQATDIDSIREWFRRAVRCVLWYMPTGAGKSFASAFMILRAMATGKTCWFIVHRRELLRQTERQFKALDVDYGLIASGHPLQLNKLVQICSIGTLIRRIDTLKKPDLAIFDECHHLRAATWTEVFKKIEGCYIVGLSASPCRADGGGLAQYFGALVATTQIRSLIDQGFLSPFRTFAPPTVDTSGLHVRHGDYIVSESEALMDTPTITGSAVGEYRRLCDGKRAIVFCCSIEHSKHVAEQFRNAGYAAYHIDGKTADSIRDMAIDDFERGKIQVLCNVDLCGEGLSINAIECVILLRPTQSLALYIQQVGRGLRTWVGKKELIILDHVGSTLKFGMIDEPREWTLTGDAEKRKKKAPPGIRVCPKCFAASAARAPACTNFPCDHVFEVKSREISEKEGKLVELTPEQIEKKRARVEQGRSQTLEALMKIEQSKGYKPGWAAHVFEARLAKRLKGTANE